MEKKSIAPPKFQNMDIIATGLLKLTTPGSQSTITGSFNHNLGYAPAFMVFWVVDNQVYTYDTFWLPAPVLYTDTDGTTFLSMQAGVTTSDFTVTIEVTPAGGLYYTAARDYDFRYYLYRARLG